MFFIINKYIPVRRVTSCVIWYHASHPVACGSRGSRVVAFIADRRLLIKNHVTV